MTTPTFEDIELFVRGVGTSTDIVRKEMYVLEDQGGRRLALRPEGTAGVARAYVEHGMHKLPQPVKLWYLAPMFRQEAPQSGRYREHWQVGAEAIGSEDPLLDAEVVSLLAGLYETLGVPGVRLRLGTLGDAASRAAHREELGAFLVRHADDLPEDARARADENPLRLFDHKDTAVAAVMAEAPRLVAFLTPEAALHIDTVERVLDAMGIAYVARRHARARARLLHAHGLRVHVRRARRPERHRRRRALRRPRRADRGAARAGGRLRHRRRAHHAGARLDPARARPVSTATSRSRIRSFASPWRRSWRRFGRRGCAARPICEDAA